jgi:fructokinase
MNMQKRTVYTIGESIYDIIFKNENPIGAKPGGAQLNASVSLGRLNVPVKFLTQYSSDAVGNMFESFLRKNNVGTDLVVRYNNGRSPISLAFLDNNNNADYTFYKIYPNDIPDHQIPNFKKDDIVLFGSFYSLWAEKRKNLINILTNAKEKGALIIYDPNFRKTFYTEHQNYKKYIKENMSYADIVRGSNDDFSLIYDEIDPQKIYEKVKSNGCNNLVLTANAGGVFLITDSINKSYQVTKVDVLSTIGAGDSFNAGLIYSIIKNDVKVDSISETNIVDWDEIVKTAIYFGIHVCTSYENYISDSFAKLIIE